MGKVFTLPIFISGAEVISRRNSLSATDIRLHSGCGKVRLSHTAGSVVFMARTEEVQIALASEDPLTSRFSLRSFWICLAVLVLCFGRVLFDLVNHSLNESLHSHILLVPFISGYLVWQLRGSLPLPSRERSPIGVICCLLGLLTLGVFGVLRGGEPLSHNDYIAINIFAFWMFLIAAAAFTLGTAFLKAIAFPLAFLVFLIPIPDQVAAGLEIASQYASAEVYSWFMNLSGATYYREGRTFVLPNLTIVVAQECSGIRSSFVLFMTSLIAGHMFLRRPWKKLILAFAVFPLGIFRNAFRIYFLSMASAHWNPDIIHSAIHHRGGPIFFALSLAPFFLFLLWLKKSERGAHPREAAESVS
jgi:exosortase C (VPDSG-CTERM-specific)